MSASEGGNRPEKKPAGESWESFAERKIREAQQTGQFRNLPGLGEPIADIDQPLEENWWLKKKLKREQLSVLPPILEARLETEKTLEAIGSLTSEYEVRRRLEKLNETIRKAHYSHIRGPADGVRQVDVEAVVREWTRTRESKQ